MTPKVLYNSGAIRTEIHKLFDKPSRSDRRVVLVAYIGQDYAKYLPDPRDIEVICSPTPGATSVRAVTELQKAGARIKFSDQLHMKVYWSAERGCLITSANLSTNALGIKGLKEAGVLLDATAVNIDQLLREAQPYKVTDPRLKQLKEEEDKFKRAMAAVGRRGSQGGYQYLDWYNSEAVARTEWKLGYSDVPVNAAKAGKELVKLRYGRAAPVDWFGVTKTQVREDDWLLTFRVASGEEVEVLGSLGWMYVHHIVRIHKDDSAYDPNDKDYRFQAIQALPNNRTPPPPFPLTPTFKTAFKAAVEKVEASEETEGSLIPSKVLLDEIARRISSKKGGTRRGVKR
jgi:hypothetical protein